ncbi:Tad domain-containing protein [Paenarthrobacter sp. YJN-5]|uniref:Tad domain-containing protein n=1 Tax=Paenarthrobacter sp. YJN-5 TaxID=2735316 RepID=UPI001D0C1A6F|nr:Tad domain-containing protein [Paenarthrobacter sp. YJN-5]
MRRMNAGRRNVQAVNETDGERGAATIIVAGMMLVLLGFAALAVDVGAMYAEKAQLQNGADAAALAIATDCANGNCGSSSATANQFANSNANDDSSGAAVTFPAATTVRVVTNARDADTGDNSFSLFFARALGIEAADVGAVAEASWGAPSAADVIPLTFSRCEADPTFFKGLQFFPTHGTSLADDPKYACKHKASSGHELPGGFGWLQHPGSACNVRVDVTNPWIEARPGSSFDGSCSSTFTRWEAALKAGKSVDILVPIFDTACPDKGGKGVNPCAASPFGKSFRIEAFAQISLRGWHLTGGGTTYLTSEAAALKSSLKLKNSDTGLYGEFIKKVSLEDAAVMGGPDTYGAMTIQLTE